MKKYVQIFMSLVLIALVNACSKSNSDEPQTTQNNKNVFTGVIYNTPWTYSKGNDDYEFTISDADITQDIMDKGAVLTYFRPAGYNIWFSVPNQNVSITISVGNVDYFTKQDPGTSDFKIVAIAADAMRGHTREQLQTLSLTQVQQLLGSRRD